MTDDWRGRLQDIARMMPDASAQLEIDHLVATRSRFERLWNGNPMARYIQLEPPIVITGLPRTGSSHLHNLLAQVESLNALPYWEAINPLEKQSSEQRRVARQVIGLQDRAIPELRALRENEVDGAEEEIALLALDGGGMFFETLGGGMNARYRDHYLATDQTPHYAFLKRALQLIIYMRGTPRRWVLKCAQHMEQLPALKSVFPKATIVTLHRDFHEVLASWVNLVATNASAYGEPDVLAIEAYWEPRLRQMLDAYEAASPEALKVDFDAFMGGELDTVEWICHAANVTTTDNDFERVIDYHESHPRYRHRRPTLPIAESTDILTP